MVAEQLSPQQLADYSHALRLRERALRLRIEARRERAWQVAQRAAALLRSEFGVARVVAFGSVVQPTRFHLRSDVDLAIWGLAEPRYYEAVGRLQGLDAEFGVDVIRFEEAPASLQAVILRDGVDL